MKNRYIVVEGSEKTLDVMYGAIVTVENLMTSNRVQVKVVDDSRCDFNNYWGDTIMNGTIDLSLENLKLYKHNPFDNEKKYKIKS